MGEDRTSSPAFEAWLSRFEADVAAEGLERAWPKHIKELVKWHRASEATSMLGSHLDRILRRDPKIAAQLAAHPAVSSEAARKPEFAEADLNHPSHQRWRNALERVTSSATEFKEILEGDGAPMRCIENGVFENWGRTIRNVPALTCFPHTKAGICNIVTWAASNGKTVRVSGYRHTWSDLYSGDGEVLISLLPLRVVTELPAEEPPIDPYNELQGIGVVGTIDECGVTKALCKIGTATTNEQFRRWCLDPGGGNLKWTVPLNVIMVEITWGGSNAPICHGAGLRNETLSDLVAAIEFVNARGQLQVVNDPDQLRAASGAFGLLGVVTAITLKLDPMTFAKLQPLKKRVALAVPPTSRHQVPRGVDMNGVTDADLDAARADFARRCEQDYYAEWFWFTLQNDCWINTWCNDGNQADSVDYPSTLETDFQAFQEYSAQLLIDSRPFSWLSETTQSNLITWGVMTLLPDGETITTPLIDALHFRRGIQNMRVLDMEWEIPIPGRADDPTKPNWSRCQDAWWAVIGEVFRLEQQGKVPMRLVLEMRIMGGSDVTMAPQCGNTLGTCAIEVLTWVNTDPGEWAGFMQTITDAWARLTDAGGRPLNLRPHWAKAWQGLKVRGMPIIDYLRTEAYADRIPEFKRGLVAVAQAGGTTIKDMQRLFSNSLLDQVFSNVFA
jgi:hypothetical protein